MFEHAIDDDAAPFWQARIHPEMHFPSRRLRRRGSRSELAKLHRSVPKHPRTLPGMSLGESRDILPVSPSIQKPYVVHEIPIKKRIFTYSINIQCLLYCRQEISIVENNLQETRLGELINHLNVHRPHIVFVAGNVVG